MKQDELYAGQPVWWLRKRAYTGAPVTKTPAIVVTLPNFRTNLVGIALRRPHSDGWYPMECAPRNLAWRDRTTETIPALFAEVADIAQRRLEQHYTGLMHLVHGGATSGNADGDDPVESELLDLEIAAGEVMQASEGSYTLQPMTDCEYSAFIAATHSEERK